MLASREGAHNIIWDALARELINGHGMELRRGQWVGPEGLGGRGKTNWGKVNNKRSKNCCRKNHVNICKGNHLLEKAVHSVCFLENYDWNG